MLLRAADIKYATPTPDRSDSAEFIKAIYYDMKT